MDIPAIDYQLLAQTNKGLRLAVELFGQYLFECGEVERKDMLLAVDQHHRRIVAVRGDVGDPLGRYSQGFIAVGEYEVFRHITGKFTRNKIHNRVILGALCVMIAGLYEMICREYEMKKPSPIRNGFSAVAQFRGFRFYIPLWQLCHSNDSQIEVITLSMCMA